MQKQKFGNEIYTSNKLIRTAYQSDSKLEHTWNGDNTKEILVDGDTVNFELNIKNVGFVDVDGLFLKSNFSKGLQITNAVLVVDGVESKLEVFNDESNFISYIQQSAVGIGHGKYITLKITANIASIMFERDQMAVEASINVIHPTYSFDTDVISYKIENKNVTVDNKEPEEPNNPTPTEPDAPEEPSTPEEPETPENPGDQGGTQQIKTYNISGMAWLDKNKDGINRNENGMEAVVVTLYGANSEGGVDISNVIATTVTNANGEYRFTNVEPGNYVVAFGYDTGLYNVTKYQVSTANSNENSDAVSKKITKNDVSNILGMTDVLVINNSSLINIDIGLVTKNDFDLSLNKYITKVVVKNNEGTKTYNYNNGTNEKIEIRSRYYKSSVVDITYKIVIKNEGELVGYVNKLVDYIPQDVKVDLSLNPGWYYGDDNNLYYNGLVGKEIPAGGSEEVLLTVRVDLASGKALNVMNAAEIAEYTNSLGFEDIDSVASNKVATEDDYGNALLIITVSTGRMAEYITTTLITIIIIAGIAMIVIKKQKQKKIYR